MAPPVWAAGDSLVVDTTNFIPLTAWLGPSDQLHLVERFVLTAADSLVYRLTVDDPSTWATPWTVETSWAKEADIIGFEDVQS
jgi:hypothetical protein